MQVKQQYELIVFPKTFNILNFYSKGLYSLQISLTAQQQGTNTLVKGFPSLVHGPDSVKNQEKKAKIIIKQNKLAYVSENFYVTFSSQNIAFHSFPVFKIQLEKQKRYKVWIDFSLVLTQYKIIRNQPSGKQGNKSNLNYLSLGSIDEKVLVVDAKRLYINSMEQINTFQRVIFSEPDYFSYSDAFIFSMRSGYKLRTYPFGLYEFNLCTIQERSRFHLVKNEQGSNLIREISEGSQKEVHNILMVFQIKRLFGQDLINFYKQMITIPVKEYRTLAYAYQHFRAMTLTLNNSSLIQDIAIPFLEYVGSDIIQHQTETKGMQNYFKHLILNYYQTDNQTQAYFQILHEAELVMKNKIWLHKQFTSLLSKINYNIFHLMASPVIKNKQTEKDNKFIFQGDIQKQKSKKHAEFLKQRTIYCNKQSIVQDIDLKHPFIMLQGYEQERVRRQSRLSPQILDNLVIFVHGYQGSDFDLQMAKYSLQLYSPNSYCLMSTSIQDEMDEPIEYLGLQLATEIKQHIKHTYNSYQRINFVGYSLGGIVIRESMRHLEEFKDKMNLFISLASPHTGTIQGANILIKTGIWYLINFQNAKNIKQLHCQFEGKQQENFILKKLSQCETLQWFHKFIVVSSQQDSFVPYSSSRIDGIECSNITKLMCENIKKRIKKLQRVQVWFDQDQNTGAMDKILGRRAHIEFLQNQVFLNCLFRLYSNQF